MGARGHQVHVFSRRAPLGRVRFDEGVRLHVVDAAPGAPPSARLDTAWPTADLRAFGQTLFDVARRERLDVVHFHYAIPFAGVVATVVRTLGSDAPAVVGTLHGTDVTTYRRRPRWARWLASALSAADALTTVSRNHASLATAVFRLPTGIEVIPNF
ncbi:MAG: glycosyltransferase, partial [Actinomycetota bacterium]